MIPAETPEIDINKFAQAARAGATFTEVSEPGQYAVGRVPGAGPTRWLAGRAGGPAQAGLSFPAAPPARENSSAPLHSPERQP